MALRRWLFTASLAAGLWAGQAAACPVCARDSGSPNRTIVFLTAMIVLPWTVVAGVALTIRKMSRDSADHGDDGEASEEARQP